METLRAGRAARDRVHAGLTPRSAEGSTLNHNLGGSDPRALRRSGSGPAAGQGGLKARLVALYLPQFHPIPENDRWWGSGFTEWTNVAAARPLFHGHVQPNLPGELGFYDLRLPETRREQADLAAAHGVEAFCYWHYWFGGRRLLERPFAEVLESGEPDFPFCLAWANQTWTGIWHGAPDRILIEQAYPGAADFERHFGEVLPAFVDERYFRVGGRPLFGIFRPNELPDASAFIEHWQSLARQAGLSGLYFVGMSDALDWDPAATGFDAAVYYPLPNLIRRRLRGKIANRLKRLPLDPAAALHVLGGRPLVYEYGELLDSLRFEEPLSPRHLPCVLPNWDNTPRSGRNGLVLHEARPELFARHVAAAVASIQHRPPDERVVFVRSWNEWAEGNYVEPDRRFGRQWLQALATAVGADAGEKHRSVTSASDT